MRTIRRQAGIAAGGSGFATLRIQGPRTDSINRNPFVPMTWEFWLTVIYFVLLTPIVVVSFIQLHLTWRYWLSRHRAASLRANSAELPLPDAPAVAVPFVTVQLPVFNERFVVGRLLECVAALDYPRDRYEIQLLDDSTDDSVDVAAAKIAELRDRDPALVIHHVRRTIRQGFKAGALQDALATAKGELIAIFDADFLPPPDFLKKTVHHFTDPNIGVVQTRWGHINERYSLLTRLQAFMLNTHYSIEQRGRNAGGYFINFNGTAGVWRRTTIDDAGGWEADTLTEDIDLSYRAQLRGWKFIYLEEQVTPGELPVTIDAFKTQQFRWNKGGAETGRKLLGRILKAPMPWTKKLHAGAHLTYFMNHLFIFLAAVLSVPAFIAAQSDPGVRNVAGFMAPFAKLSMIAYGLVFFTSHAVYCRHHGILLLLRFLLMYPLFLTFFLGMTLHNAWAVAEGVLGFKSPFVRTPKFNITTSGQSWREQTRYLSRKLSLSTYAEGFLAAYFWFAAVWGWRAGELQFLGIHLMLACGFTAVFTLSVKHAWQNAG